MWKSSSISCAYIRILRTFQGSDMHIELDSSALLTKFWLPMSYPWNFIMKKCTSI